MSLTALRLSTMDVIAGYRFDETSEPLIDVIGDVHLDEVLSTHFEAATYQQPSLIPSDSNKSVKITTVDGKESMWSKAGIANDSLPPSDVNGVEVWITPTTLTGIQWLIGRRTDVFWVRYELKLEKGTTGSTIFASRRNDADTIFQSVITNTEVIFEGAKYQIVVDFDLDGTPRLFLNAVLLTDVTTGSTNATFGSPTRFSVGGTVAGNGFVGGIDELYVLGTAQAITAAQVLALWHRGNRRGRPVMTVPGLGFGSGLEQDGWPGWGF